MKRFFKAIEKDSPNKKPAISQDRDDSETPQEQDKANSEPSKFLTWNANSFLLRVKNNWPEFTKFVSDFDPEVIAIQEVRMPAASSKGAPKNPGELKDDTSSSREEKQVSTHPNLLRSALASKVKKALDRKHKNTREQGGLTLTIVIGKETKEPIAFQLRMKWTKMTLCSLSKNPNTKHTEPPQ